MRRLRSAAVPAHAWLVLALGCGAAPAPDAVPVSFHRGAPTIELPAHPGWVRLYQRVWRIAEGHVRLSTAAAGLADRYLDEGFLPNVFQWDSCFMSMFADYSAATPGIESLDSFYRKQHANGFICRELSEVDGSDVWPEASPSSANPPLFAWAEWLSYEKTGDRARLEQVLPALVRYFGWMSRHRRNDDGTYWSNGYGSGMDNSPRGGPDSDPTNSHELGWVDMTSQQALAARMIARIAGELGDRPTQAAFGRRYEALTALINTRMWDDARETYFDVTPLGAFTGVRTLASFWPMVAGVAGPERCPRLVGQLLDPALFWTEHPFPTLAVSDPSYNPTGEYWKGGVWAPTNAMVLHGLRECGEDDLAREAAVRQLDAMAAVESSTRTIWESYAPEGNWAGMPANPEFVGWSGWGPVAGLIEFVLGITLDAPHRRVEWRLGFDEPYAVRDLRLGPASAPMALLSLAYTPGNPGEVEVSTTGAVELVLSRDGVSATYALLPGHTQLAAP